MLVIPRVEGHGQTPGLGGVDRIVRSEPQLNAEFACRIDERRVQLKEDQLWIFG